MRKICVVVQRYGDNILGGSESACRSFVQRLKEHFEVEVLTTKCTDYVTWENDIDADEEYVDGILVRRWAVEKRRNLSDELNARALSPLATVETGKEWVREQGPLCPGLIDYVREHRDDYDVFMLMTYLYYTTVFSIPLVGDKAIIVPTAHDEACIHQPVYKGVLEGAAGWFAITPEELAFLQRTFDSEGILVDVGGVGCVVAPHGSAGEFREKFGLGDAPYLVYAGRISSAKGCDELFHYFLNYKLRHPASPLKLVLMGKADISIPDHKDIVSLGFVDEADKYAGMEGALALVQSSPFESLSMVVLEALRVNTPVLVNGRCDVLKGHCLRSNAGLFYTNFAEFERMVDFYMTHEEERVAMGQAGPGYVDTYYRWSTIMDKLERMLNAVADCSAEAGRQ